VRVAITHPYSWPDVRRGAERVIAETSVALAARGHDVTVLTSGGAASRTRRDGVRTVRYRRLFSGSYRHEHWFGWRILPALLLGRFDVVHSLAPWDAVTSIHAARVTGHRTIYQEVGNPIRSEVERRGDRTPRERVIRDIDVFGCMSEFSRSHLVEGWGRSGTIIPGGVRLSDFCPVRRRDRPTILFAGAFERPMKHVRELLAAVAVLARRQPEVQLLLSGPGDAGPLLAEAPAAARERTTVLPLGEPGDLPIQYASAWVTCLPTLIDSFGLVVVESMAAGTPVVVGPEGAPRELVDPQVGVVAPSLEPEPLAAALAQALQLSQRPEAVERCRAVARRYDWDGSVAPLLEALYEGTGRDGA
jgi:phosphatidyl-myo-inositol alpha-mannosyltransferase